VRILSTVMLVNGIIGEQKLLDVCIIVATMYCSHIAKTQSRRKAQAFLLTHVSERETGVFQIVYRWLE